MVLARGEDGGGVACDDVFGTHFHGKLMLCYLIHCKFYAVTATAIRRHWWKKTADFDCDITGFDVLEVEWVG